MVTNSLTSATLAIKRTVLP